MTDGALPAPSARGLGRWIAFPRARFPWVIWLCLAWVAAMLLISLLVPWIAPFGYAEQSLLQRLKPPSWLGGNEAYLLGTDNLGRDVFSRVLYAIRTSIAIALIGTLIGTTIGTVLGILAAHFRGWVEDLIMALVDFQASMPFIIMALAVLAFFGNSLELFLLLVGLYGWETYARLVRGLVLSANADGYAGAIRTLGIHPVRIYWRHVIPNIAGTLVVQTTLNFPDLILLETSLSFLGLGVQPPQTSLGLMLGEGRNYLAMSWWIGVPAGLIIFGTTLSISLLGDWFRDHLDKTLRKRLG